MWLSFMNTEYVDFVSVFIIRADEFFQVKFQYQDINRRRNTRAEKCPTNKQLFGS